LRRSQIHEIGNVGYPSQVLDLYSTGFEKNLKIEAIRNSSSKVVIDYAYSFRCSTTDTLGEVWL
jgi:mannose-1-phosphate guanylyltransferase/phosphomannomutase